MLYKWTGESGKYLTHGKVYEFRRHDEEEWCFRDDTGNPDHFWPIDTMYADGWEIAKDGPVREVTRREIVPGTYGKVRVTEGRYVHCKSMSTAEELREAAHILNQIAEAME